MTPPEVNSTIATWQKALMSGGLGVPGIPGLITPVWMVLAFTGLAVGRSTISR